MRNENVKRDEERRVLGSRKCYYDTRTENYFANAMCKKYGVKKEVNVEFTPEEVKEILQDRVFETVERECRQEVIDDLNYGLKETLKLIATFIVSFSVGWAMGSLIVKAIKKLCKK